MTQTQEKKSPKCNGSFNWSISPNEFSEYSIAERKAMAWSIICELKSGYSFRDVEPKVFTAPVVQYTYDMIADETVDTILLNVYTQFQQLHKQLLSLTADYQFKQGQKLQKVQVELQFGGFLKLNANQLKGYLMAIGSWNDFDCSTVCSAITNLELLVPKRDYGPNNINTGTKMHTWTTTGEYITIMFDYLCETDRARVMDFYKNHFVIYGEIAHADSVRFEENKFPDRDACSLELIMWWD